MESNQEVDLSVIFPVLNNSAGLDRALSSVVTQYDNKMELLIIDGGSTDNFMEVIDKYKHYITYWETGCDKNLSDAFNRGILHSKGEFVSILNSDDLYEDNALCEIRDLIHDNAGTDVFYGKVRYKDWINNTNYIRIPNINHMKYRMSLFHSSMFVRKSTYDLIGLYSEEYDFAMDSEWCHRAIIGGVKFRYVDKVVSCMSLGGRSDVNYTRSLIEYRESALNHKVASWTVASLSFIILVILKKIVRIRLVNKLKYFILYRE